MTDPFDRAYAALFARNRALYADKGAPLHSDAGLAMPATFPPFIRELERQADRVRVEVGGRQYWIIYSENARWQEIDA